MKNGKSKLLTIIFAFILSMGAISFGVYAAYCASLTGSGTVNFNAYGIDVDVDGSITGAVGTGITTTYVGTTNTTRQPSKNLISSTPWNFGNLGFDEENAMSIDDLLIEIKLKITNYSNFAIEASVTVPVISGIIIEKEDINYSYSYDSNIGADIRYAIIKFKPASLENSVSLTNLNLSLNISKTLKKETEISKFQWSTPSGGKVAIIGNNLTVSDTKIIIPRKFENNLVTEIDGSIIDSGLSYCIATSITIPNGVTTIGNSAFMSCNNVTFITIPSKVTSIGIDAFYGCSKATSLIISANVETIYLNAFRNCSALESVYFERTSIFTSLGSSCFNGLKRGSKLYFKNSTVSDQFIAGTHYTSANTTKALY